MRSTILATAICAALIGLSAAEEAHPAAREAIAIPAQNLGPALRTLAKDRKIQLLFRSELVRNLQTAGAAGDLTTDEALAQLLTGTGLIYTYLDEKTVTVVNPIDVSPADARSGTEAISAAPTSENLYLAESSKDSALAESAASRNGSEFSPAEKTRQSEAIEEIIVTAQKRKERLIDAPQSISVLSANTLTKQGATQFRDWANMIPGLNFTTTGAGLNSISIRGVTAGNDVGPTVGIYVDEVPYGSNTIFGAGAGAALDMALFDVDRIEVLRGPQGTLYGASTMGGLLKYVTKQPSTDGFSGNAQAGLSGTQNGGVNYNAAVAVNAPIAGEKLALRASGFNSRDGGYIDNVALGQKDINGSDIYGGRADLLFTPNEALAVRITGFLQNIDREGKGAADYLVSSAPLDGDLDQSLRIRPEPFYQRFRLVSGTLTYDLGWASATSVSSYQSVESEIVNDLSLIYVPLLAQFYGLSYGAASYEPVITTRRSTQEVRLASEGARTLEWLAGGFYTRESSDVSFVIQPFDLAGEPTTADLANSSQPSRYEEYAAFANLTWHLTDKLDMTGGIRYARNEMSTSRTGSGILNGPDQASTHSTDNVATYLANARYHFNGHTTAYLRYATGYRPGGPNFTSRDPVTGLPIGPPTFDSDSLKSYEVGFKAETADRRFAIDVAGYFIDWSNIQIQISRNGFGGISNAPGGASVRGGELTLSAHPVRGLTMTSAFAYQDPALSEADSDLGGAKGERLPNVPRFTAALNADYELSPGNLRPRAGATVRYVDDRTAGFGATAYPLPDYTVVDLRAGLTLGAVDAQIYLSNLLDEHGQLSTHNIGGILRTSILQPRTLGISITTAF